MKNIKIKLGIVIFFAISQIQAQDTYTTNDRFPFEYDKRSKTPTVCNAWDKAFSELKIKFMDKDNLIILHSYSSASGKDKYNYKLSKDRGNSVKDFLVNNGVDPFRIQIEAHGEPSIENYGNEDYAGDRDVLPEFKRIPPEKYTDLIDAYRNQNSLKQDIQEGEKIFQHVVEPDIASVKKRYIMVRKVFLDNPSAEPEVLKEQVKDVLKEMIEIETPKDLGEFVAKIGLDSFIDLFTSSGSKRVNVARQIKYDVIKDAVTGACFPKYKLDTEHYSFEEKMLFNAVKIKMRQLSNHDKYKVRAYFIAGKTFEMYSFPSSWRFEHKMQSISMFQHNLDNWFNRSEYRYRD